MKDNDVARTIGKQKQDRFSPVSYLIISLFFLFIAIIILVWLVEKKYTPAQQGLVFYIVLLIVGMSFAAFIFGVMQSYAQYTSKKFKGKLILGGPIVGAALVVVGGSIFLTKTIPIIPVNDNEESAFSVEFTMSLAGEDTVKDWVLGQNFSYRQIEPNGRNEQILAPQLSSTGHPFYEAIIRHGIVDLPDPGELYIAKIHRVVYIPSFGSPSDILTAILCFEGKNCPQDNKAYILEFDCKEGKNCELNRFLVDKFGSCNSRRGKIPFSLTGIAYADNNSVLNGWIVPTLQTLKKRNETEGISYTGFRIKSDRLPGLEQADSYTYEVKVNDTPIYIDGWTKKDTRTTLEPQGGLNLEFGLENLDFSGEHEGQELISVVFDFYGEVGLLKSIRFERYYIALRKVEPVTIVEDGIQFDWIGEYIIGKAQDGYQLFIWSTTDKKELLNRQRWFNQANVSFENQKAVAVIRPPLTSRNYGLSVGLVDKVGRIKFTFSQNDVKRIHAWVKQDLVEIRIDSHPIVRRKSWIRKLHGN